MPAHGTGAGLPNNASSWIPAELLRSVLSLGYNRGAETQRGPQSVPRPPSAMCSPTATTHSHSPRSSYTQGKQARSQSMSCMAAPLSSVQCGGEPQKPADGPCLVSLSRPRRRWRWCCCQHMATMSHEPSSPVTPGRHLSKVASPIMPGGE